MSNDRRYCVYLHKDQEGTVRYVGEGGLSRPRNKHRRNKEWNEIFKNSAPTIEIVASHLTKVEALKLEAQLILEHRATICNSYYSKNSAKILDIEYLKNIVYYSETSKSGLRYTQDLRSGIHGNSISRRKDSEAGFLDRNGYWSVKIDGVTYKNHRIIVMLHGHELDQNLVVNHIDNNPSNNLIENLEVCTTVENCRKKKYHTNRSLHRLNKTGETGISIRNVGGTNYLIYTVSYCSDRKQFVLSLKTFDYDVSFNLLKKFKNVVNTILTETKTFDKIKFQTIFEELKKEMIQNVYKAESTSME